MPEYSPILSIVTAAFELTAAAWVLRKAARREGRPAILRPVALLLVFLAGYQLIEVFVCAQPDAPLWAKLAFADVVWLPPLGWLLLVRIAAIDGPVRALWRGLTTAWLAIAAGLTVWVLVDPLFVTSSVCKTVIALYTHPSNGLEIYGAYYHIGLWGMIGGGLAIMLKSPTALVRAHAGDMAVGTVAFVVLALTTEIVFPGAKGATPSIMCHYAIALAVCFVRLAAREGRPRTSVEPTAA